MLFKHEDSCGMRLVLLIVRHTPNGGNHGVTKFPLQAPVPAE